MNIGNKIKELRRKSGITQDQLAQHLGISPQSVSKWETNTTMPDITLLPLLSKEFGITIDELFDLSSDIKLKRIEKKLDIEESLSREDFYEFEHFLTEQLNETNDDYKILSLLANLYHHRMESDSKLVSKYAREVIMRHPEEKDCQWLLNKAEGAVIWDWNIDNHNNIISFYKDVIKNDKGTPKSSLPYLYLIDNLLDDKRINEVKEYLDIYKTLPSHRDFLIPVYEAYIALGEYDLKKADQIMNDALIEFKDNSRFLFEYAQYQARNCRYDKAIEIYERCWKMLEDKLPRYTDYLEAIAVIYEIQNNYPKAIETYKRVIECIKEEWGYKDDEAPVLEVERKIKNLQNKIESN